MSSEQAALVEIYTLFGCGHCARAENLLQRRGISFSEISGDGRRSFRRELRELTGRSTVPQIVIDGTPVGGASDLARLDRRGLLEPLAGRQPFPRAVLGRRLSLTGLASALVGGKGGPWRYTVEIVNRDGSVAERLPAPEAVAREWVDAFNADRGTVIPAAGRSAPPRPGKTP